MSEANQKRNTPIREARHQTATSEATKQGSATDEERQQRKPRADPRESAPPKCRKQNRLPIANDSDRKVGESVTWDQKTSATHSETSKDRQRSKPVLGRARKALLSQKRTLRVEEAAVLAKKKYRKGLSIKAAVLL